VLEGAARGKAAFPSGLPRPLVPQLLFRSFHTKRFTARAVRLVVLQNKCTGAPAYQDPNGTMDNDPTNPTDCTTGSTQGTSVDLAELELFGSSRATVTVHQH
jgi:extracellular elastinolytic metalloproteinase